MNRFRVIRRAFALTAGAGLMIAATLAVASPASAHHSIVRGTCAQGADGNWIVNWTVANSETDIPATLKTVEFRPAGATVAGIAPGVSIPAGGQVTGSQVVPADQKSARLTVQSEWIRDGKTIGERDGKPKTRQVWFKKDKCAAPEPTSPATPQPTATPTATPPATPPATPGPGEPDLEVLATCDELSLTFTNPDDGEEFEVTLTPSAGDAVTVEVAAGGSETVTFPATEGFTVEVVVGDEKATVAWEEPQDCGGEGGGLPVTGAAVGGTIGAAAVLLAIGVGLFVMGRRRRVSFTA